MIELHTLELSKLPECADGTKLYNWAKFINAESEEELNMIAERDPQVQKAVVKLVELSADEKARDMAERREKARRDMEMWKDYGIEQGLQQGKEQGLQQGLEQGRAEEREIWQGVVADKDAEIERLRKLLENAGK